MHDSSVGCLYCFQGATMNADRVLMAFLAKLSTEEGRAQLLDSFDSLEGIRQLTVQEQEIYYMIGLLNNVYPRKRKQNV